MNRFKACVWSRSALALMALLSVVIVVGACATAPRSERELRRIEDQQASARIKARYTKSEHMVTMRDGVKLHTTVYAPRDKSRSYPILFRRTPYSVRPYGPNEYPRVIAPSRRMEADGYIFVQQDVRGRYMSEGEFSHMRPHMDEKRSPSDIDESSDTYDTIDWLVREVPRNNGKVGMWGISYPGFYCSAGMIDAHPALKAVSPQAPIGDFYFDDFHHHGAFFLPHGFNFMASFGRPRPEPTTKSAPRFKHPTPDGYEFFLEMGPLSNADALHFKGDVAFWNEMMAHPNYDEFWQSRNIMPHLNKVAPAVMTVGGWFDAEDLYGPLETYRSVEARNPGVFNVLVMGPWSHGQWARDDGQSLGGADFGAKTSLHYREHIEKRFFEHYLKGGAAHGLPEMSAFETGANRWRSFDVWPPAERAPLTMYLRGNGGLDRSAPAAGEEAFAEYISDPAKPVPYTEVITPAMTKQYMTDDQRFAGRRTDVVVFQTPVLEESLTIAGPIDVTLWVSTSGTDSDWIVKVIDVYPPKAKDHEGLRDGQRMGGYQMMIRSEVIRGKYRNSYEKPEAFEPNAPTLVKLPLQDVLHTFRPGHRMMVQVQSTWFPLVDRNPQTFVANINEAKPEDFVKATQRIYHSPEFASALEIGVIPTAEPLEPEAMEPEEPEED